MPAETPVPLAAASLAVAAPTMDLPSPTAPASTNNYALKPALKSKFHVKEAQAIIHDVLAERLTDTVYSPEVCSQLTKEISDEIKSRLKNKDWIRYKYVVNVTIGEFRGEGVRMGCRCFWDDETDGLATHVFKNDSVFCVATAYGLYFY